MLVVGTCTSEEAPGAQEAQGLGLGQGGSIWGLGRQEAVDGIRWRQAGQQVPSEGVEDGEAGIQVARVPNVGQADEHLLIHCL